jgi:lysophospholipase L1-like esterase
MALPARRLVSLALPVVAAAAAVTVVAGCTGPRASSDSTGSAPPRPRAMAALGDSITRAFAACDRGGDCVESSWATGTDRDVDSHRLRLDLGDGSSNVAVSGARVADLASQVDAAVRVRPDYLTVLIGANDACAPTEAAMTPVDDYTRAFDGAMATLVRELPDVRILVLSVPDLARLWEVGKDRDDVRRVWQTRGICQTMLADPTDTSAGAQARRDRVRQRVQAYNAAMAAACSRHAAQCRHDRGAVFGHRFTLDDVSTLDFWHPSARGQATLAEVAWKAGYWS